MATRVVHGDQFQDLQSGAVVPPLAVSTTFVHGNPAGLDYGREHNPTWTLLETAVGGLEEAAWAVSFSSGMGTVSAVFDLVPPGGKVVVSRDAYTGSRLLLQHLAGRGSVALELVDATDPAALEEAAQGASLIWLETIGNPLLTVPDLPRCAQTAHAAGALLAVDSTLATPIICRPLELGADLVIHSASKFLGGHDDLMLGVVAGRDRKLQGQLHFHRTNFGACPGQLEAWLALRGLRTLDVRVRRQMASAQFLAERLGSLPLVARVHYPGLPEHPQHGLAARQLEGGFGALVSIELNCDAEATERRCAATRIWANATSLGSVGSLLERRARWPGDEYLPPGLVRLSVGLEDARDLLSDLTQALSAVPPGS